MTSTWAGPKACARAGLDSLTTIAGSFWLSGGIDLLSVGGLPELKCVAGNFDFAGSEYAYTNNRLRTADGFPKLQSIGGSVWLGPHPALQTASLLGAVQFIGGDLDVRGSPQLWRSTYSALEHAGRISVPTIPLSTSAQCTPSWWIRSSTKVWRV